MPIQHIGVLPILVAASPEYENAYSTHRRPSTEKMVSPWSQQARQLTPRRETVAHLGN